jgi:hypothetical protein
MARDNREDKTMAQFSKRHYQAIAQVMQEIHPGEQFEHGDDCEGTFTALDQWDETKCRIAVMFQSDNSLFNRNLFLQACQPGANVRARKVA